MKGKDYEDFILQPNKEINEELKKYEQSVKIINFPRGSGESYINFVEEVDCDVISVDQTSPEQLRVIAQERNIVIQGDLDPEHLAQGGEKMKREIKRVLDKYKNNFHIFNLSHGILPHTPIENVKETINIISYYGNTKRTSNNTK